MEQAGSRNSLEAFDLEINRGIQVSQQSSGILELEPGARVHRVSEEEVPSDVPDGEVPGASSDGEMEETGIEHSEAQSNLSAPRFQEPQADFQTPIRQIEEAPTRVERQAEERPDLSNRGTEPKESPPPQEAVEKAKARKVKIAKKKKGRGAKVTNEELIETAPARATAQPPMQPPEASAPPKSAGEEALLSKLVRELEFGTLQNSISYLNQLVAKCPDDPDYKSLLTMALRLRDGDVWYQYQRKVDYKEPEVVKIPATIMKPTPNDNVNELKKSSWFLIRSVKR